MTAVLLLVPILDASTVETPSVNGANTRSVGLEVPGIETGSHPGQRKALVIGNAAYPASPLKNTLNDARAVADALHSIGFKVTIESNTDLKTLRGAIGRFVDSIMKDDVVMFFYAGHGIEIEGLNYLIPIDFNAERSTDVPYAAYPLNQLLDALEQHDPAVSMIVLDACRNNPYIAGTRAFGKRGLALVQAGSGSLIAYATSPGKTAGDGNGRNGVFTESFVKFLRTSGIDIETMFKRVSDDVANKTKKEQIPWRSSSIVGHYYLAGPPTGGRQDERPAEIPMVSGPRVSDRSGLTYAWMPGGVFEAGCLKGRSPCDQDEFPSRTANVGSFYLSTTEITVAAYRKCVAAGACKPLSPSDDSVKSICNFLMAERDAHPMNCITWEEAQNFCKWDSGRLTSPDEWEFAASAGKSALHPWGDDAADGRHANYCDRGCLESLPQGDRDRYISRGWVDMNHDDGWSGTAPVGSYPAGDNPWGVHDLLGNVTEWTAGAYNASTKELRGGDWSSDVKALRASNRSKSVPGFRSEFFGARCAR